MIMLHDSSSTYIISKYIVGILVSFNDKASCQVVAGRYLPELYIEDATEAKLNEGILGVNRAEGSLSNIEGILPPSTKIHIIVRLKKLIKNTFV